MDATARLVHAFRLRQPGTCRITLELPGQGLFMHLNAIAAIAASFARVGQGFEVRAITAHYAPRPREDWFGQLFVDLRPLPRLACPRSLAVRGLAQLPPAWRPDHLNMADARTAFFGKFAITPVITAMADEFHRRHFRNGQVLGVHYRGTDKAYAAPRAAYDEVLYTIRHWAETGRYQKVFVATDEARFLDFMVQRSPLPVIAQGVERSTGLEPLYLAEVGDGLRRAVEALIDCQLLARCATLLKTASALSGWSVLLNPDLEVEFLNRPYPESVLFPDEPLLERDREG